MDKINVLFVCLHNSARSQMAEAFLNEMGGDRFLAESAGIEPGKLNPVAVEAMKDAGIDISENKTKSVFKFYRQGKYYDYVITVCEASAGERCPVFPGRVTRLHWEFEDPSAFQGTDRERLEKTKVVRNRIKEKIEKFITEVKF